MEKIFALHIQLFLEAISCLRCISWLTKPQIAVGGFECNSVRGRCWSHPHLSTGTWAWEPLCTPHWTKNKQNGKYKIQKHTLPIDTRMPVMLKHNNLCFYASTKYELYILQIVAQSMIWSNNLLYPIWLWSHGWKGVFTVLLEPWEISPRMTWDSWGRDVLRWLRRGGKALRTWWLAA